MKIIKRFLFTISFISTIFLSLVYISTTIYARNITNEYWRSTAPAGNLTITNDKIKSDGVLNFTEKITEPKVKKLVINVDNLTIDGNGTTQEMMIELGKNVNNLTIKNISLIAPLSEESDGNICILFSSADDITLTINDNVTLVGGSGESNLEGSSCDGSCAISGYSKSLTIKLIGDNINIKGGSGIRANKAFLNALSGEINISGGNGGNTLGDQFGSMAGGSQAAIFTYKDITIGTEECKGIVNITGGNGGNVKFAGYATSGGLAICISPFEKVGNTYNFSSNNKSLLTINSKTIINCGKNGTGIDSKKISFPIDSINGIKFSNTSNETLLTINNDGGYRKVKFISVLANKSAKPQWQFLFSKDKKITESYEKEYSIILPSNQTIEVSLKDLSL